MDTNNLFVYGTLIFDGVLESLLGRIPKKEPAQAEGFDVITIHLDGWQPFPVMIKSRYNRGTIKKVDGYILKDLTNKDFEILDRYEYVYKGYYIRQQLKTVCGKLANYYDPADNLFKIGTLGKPWDLTELDPMLESAYVESVLPEFKKGHPDLFM
ncbi:MAG: hypothetical protein ACJA0E_000595 [Bermanella sp.]|jgi:hypothetical protein